MCALYGATPATFDHLQGKLRERFPRLEIRGAEPSKFRQLSPAEKAGVVERIRASGAPIVFVGLACPRQAVCAYEYREEPGMHILAVGAAFDFHAGRVVQAPRWMQDHGLEWLFRLQTEPRRLWRRYLLINPWYTYLVTTQRLGLRRYPSAAPAPTGDLSYG